MAVCEPTSTPVWVKAFCLSAMTLAASCAHSEQDSQSSSESAVSLAVDRTGTGFEDAALAPLSDLNLRRTPIPERLLKIQSPYLPQPLLHCDTLAREVEALTEVLGPDVDVQPENQDDPTLKQRAGEEAGDAALNTIESTTTGFIPFRGLVRQATGATAHEKKVRRAYERGIQRRAFLKGVGFAVGCEAPAAPLPWTPTTPSIEYRKTAPE